MPNRVVCSWSFLLWFCAPIVAQRELLDRLPQDQEAIRFTAPDFGASSEIVELPGDGAIQGLAAHDDTVWALRGDRLLTIAWPSTELQKDVAAPAGLVGLCSDGRFLYAATASGVGIIDPGAGHVVRTLPVSFATAPLAIAHRTKTLCVATREDLHTIDVASGEVGSVTKLARPPAWLASDGAGLWQGTRYGCGRLDDFGDPEVAFRRWPVKLEGSCATFVRGRLLVSGRHVLVGGERGGICVAVGGLDEPMPMRLTVRVRRCDGDVRYEIGPKVLTADLAGLELQRLAQDPKSMVPERGGERRLMPVAIVVGEDVSIGDVARTWDLAKGAGFTDVSCPAIEAWARRRGPASQPAAKDGK